MNASITGFREGRNVIICLFYTVLGGRVLKEFAEYTRIVLTNNYSNISIKKKKKSYFILHNSVGGGEMYKLQGIILHLKRNENVPLTRGRQVYKVEISISCVFFPRKKKKVIFLLLLAIPLELTGLTANSKNAIEKIMKFSTRES